MIKLKELLKETKQSYFYHATTAEALPKIIKQGLLPSTGNTHWGGDLGKFSEKKVFVTNNFNTAVFYGNAGIWKSQHQNRFKPLLRFKYNELKLEKDLASKGDFYSKIPIISSFEIFVGNENTDNRGDVHYNVGTWRLLTFQIADSIYHGEWDGEIVDDL